MNIYKCGQMYIIAPNAVVALKIKIANGMVGEIKPFKRPLKKTG